MKFNLNDTATVTLTDTGARIYNAYQDQFLSLGEPHVREGDKLKIQFWNLLQIFGGKSIYLGMPTLPFVDNVIELNEDKATETPTQRVAFFMNMVLAGVQLDCEAAGTELKDDTRLFVYNGPGCSDMLTVEQIKAFLNEVKGEK